MDMKKRQKTQTRDTEKRNRRSSTDKVNNTETVIIRKRVHGLDNTGTRRGMNISSSQIEGMEEDSEAVGLLSQAASALPTSNCHSHNQVTVQW
jgi:hypothetical protein